MKLTRHSPEQILCKLSETDSLLSENIFLAEKERDNDMSRMATVLNRYWENGDPVPNMGDCFSLLRGIPTSEVQHKCKVEELPSFGFSEFVPSSSNKCSKSYLDAIPICFR